MSEPYHPEVEALIDALGESDPALVRRLHATAPHTLAALVSKELSIDKFQKAIALLELGRLAEAKSVVGIETWHEAQFSVSAIGPHFRGTATSREFAQVIGSFVPTRNRVSHQQTFLTLVSVALTWSTEAAAIVIAHSYQEYYELTSDEVALMAPVFWHSRFRSGVLGRCMRGPVPLGCTTGEAVAETRSAWLFAMGYLRNGTKALRPIIAPQTFGLLDVAQVVTRTEARALAKHLGPEAFDLVAEGYRGRDAWALSVRRQEDQTVVGMVLILSDGSRLSTGRVIAPGGDVAEGVVKSAGASVITGINMRGGIAAHLPTETRSGLPDDSTLQKRWDHIIGRYHAAPDRQHDNPYMPSLISHDRVAKIEATLAAMKSKATRFTYSGPGTPNR